MIRTVLSFLLGFIGALIIFSLLSSWSLCAFLFAILLTSYFIFFPTRSSRAITTLSGILCATAILDTGRIGREVLLGVVIYGIITYCRDIARFTSEYNRFIVAGTLIALLSIVILLPPSSYLVSIWQLVVALILILIVTSVMQQRNRPSDYELL